MKLQKRTIIVANLIFIASVFAVASAMIDSQQSNYEKTLLNDISTSQQRLISIASERPTQFAITNSKGVIHECQNRGRHDELLGKLSNLKGEELSEARHLHAVCGQVQPVARLYRADQLAAAFAAYSQQVNLLNTVAPERTQEYQVGAWLEVVEQDTEIAEKLSKQTTYQLQIIDALIAGDNAKVNSLAEEALELNNNLDALGRQFNQNVADLITI